MGIGVRNEEESYLHWVDPQHTASLLTHCRLFTQRSAALEELINHAAAHLKPPPVADPRVRTPPPKPQRCIGLDSFMGLVGKLLLLRNNVEVCQH
ncbi:hypothetical protein NQZ68_022533 [Dissostichus eleginoides]|nr:hypothetical protein NQZ68_022533 [Dissostichus eleginoides]